MSQRAKAKRCLNCGSEVESKFCPECGQSIDTHRYVIGQVMLHDFLLNMVYYRQGFFFTVARLFTKPGITVREFITGKRVSVVHPVTLLIVVVILHSLAQSVTSFHISSISSPDSSELVDAIEDFMRKHPKMFYVGVVPFDALFSFIFFGKAKLNYAEHLVLNAFKAAASLLISTAFILVTIVVLDITILKKLNTITAILGIAYSVWYYYQCFYPFYSNKILLFVRALFCFAIPLLLVTIALMFYFKYRLA